VINFILKVAIVVLDAGVWLGEKKHGLLLIFGCQILVGIIMGLLLLEFVKLVGIDKEIFLTLSFEH
jgi:hypothetical protein